MRFIDTIRQFALAVVRSCYDVGYYRGVRERGWARALGYFASFSVIVALVAAVPAYQAMERGLMQARDSVLNRVPDGTFFDVRDGKMAAGGIEQPWEMVEEDFQLLIDDSVIGTAFPERLNERESGVFLGADGMFIKSPDGARQIQLWKDTGDFRLSKDQVAGWLQRWWPWLMSGLGFLVLLGLYLAAFVGSLLFVVLAAGTIVLLGRFSRRQERFVDWLAIGLHAVTLPALIDALGQLVKFPIPYAFSVIFAMVMIAVMMDQRAAPTGGSEPGPTV